MSFGHFVHNWRIRDEQLAPQCILEDGTMELLNLDLTRQPSNGQFTRGHITSDASGNILWVPRSQFATADNAFGSSTSTQYISNDFGETWETREWDDAIDANDIVVDNDSYANKFMYDPTNLRVYMTAINLTPIRDRYDFYSTDWGKSWTKYTFGGPTPLEDFRWYGLSLYVRGDGLLVGAARRTQDNIGIWGSQDGLSASFLYNTAMPAVTTYDITKAGDGYYCYALDGPASANRHLVKLDQFGRYVSHGSNWNTSRWPIRFTGGDGGKSFWLRRISSQPLQAFKLDADSEIDGTQAQLDDVYTDFDFGDTATWGDISYHPDAGWIAIAKSAGNLGNSLRLDAIYAKYSTDGINWSDETLEFLLPPEISAEANVGSIYECTYIGQNKWAVMISTLDLVGGANYSEKNCLLALTMNAIC